MKNMEYWTDRLRLLRLYFKLGQIEFADKLGLVQQQVSKYENGRIEPSAKFFENLYDKTGVNLQWLFTGEGEMFSSAMPQERPSDIFFIPYWEDCPKCADKIKKPTVTGGISLDRETIINEWGCEPDNLRIISTPGEEMDGGQYPIRNNDILVIDTSKTNMSDSGVYLITTHNGTVVTLRRLMELLDGTVAFYVENEKYAFAINKVYTREELDAIGFNVVGRVVKNVTYTL